MNIGDRELERSLRSLPDKVEPSPHLREKIKETLRTEKAVERGSHGRIAGIAIAAALAVFVGVAVVVRLATVESASESLTNRLERVRGEMESIIASVEVHAPEAARRIRSEFDRIVSEMAAVAAQIDAGTGGEEARIEMATLLNEQLRLVDHAVTVRLAVPTAGTE